MIIIITSIRKAADRLTICLALDISLSDRVRARIRGAFTSRRARARGRVDLTSHLSSFFLQRVLMSQFVSRQFFFVANI